MVSDPKCEAEVAAILRDRRHPAFATMWAKVAERGYKKPAQAVEVSGPNGADIPLAITVTRRIVRPGAAA